LNLKLRSKIKVLQYLVPEIVKNLLTFYRILSWIESELVIEETILQQYVDEILKKIQVTARKLIAEYLPRRKRTRLYSDWVDDNLHSPPRTATDIPTPDNVFLLAARFSCLLYFTFPFHKSNPITRTFSTVTYRRVIKFVIVNSKRKSSCQKLPLGGSHLKRSWPRLQVMMQVSALKPACTR
jgi:hypothetical protein